MKMDVIFLVDENELAPKLVSRLLHWLGSEIPTGRKASVHTSYCSLNQTQ
jgi:hypothetical protein